jgi:hypothetical protein
MPDHEDRLALVDGRAGDDGVIVGEAAIAVQLDEIGKQPIDVIQGGGPRRMPRDLDPLPRGEVPVQVAADRIDAPFKPGDLAIALLTGI